MSTSMRFAGAVALSWALVAAGCARSSAGDPAGGGPSEDDGGLDAGPGTFDAGDLAPDASRPDADRPDAATLDDGGPVPDAGEVCPATTCEDVFVSALGSTLDACCPGDGADCGYDLRPTAALLGLTAAEVACLATDQPGDEASACPDRDVLGVVTLQGCCRDEDGTCGFLANLPTFGLPSFGCVPTRVFAGTTTPAACTP